MTVDYVGLRREIDRHRNMVLVYTKGLYKHAGRERMRSPWRDWSRKDIALLLHNVHVLESILYRMQTLQNLAEGRSEY